MTAPIVIDYYSDVLCVWAWIAQRRIDALNEELSGKIEVRHHYLDVFGDSRNKISTQWAHRGGYGGFAEHVVNSAKPYLDASINPNIWHKVKPSTSANAHVVLKAAELKFGKNKSIELALLVRQAFYLHGEDISQMGVLMDLLAKAECELEPINEALSDGSAMAALMANYQQAKALSLKGSPTYIIDDGRQMLYGNVSYRVLLANIKAHIKQTAVEASCC